MDFWSVALMLLILMASREPAAMGKWFDALAAAWAATAGLITASHAIMKLIGRRGLRAAEKLIGMLLIMIAIQMFLNGVEEYPKNLPTARRG